MAPGHWPTVGEARPTRHRGESPVHRKSAGKSSSKGRGRDCTAGASRRSPEVGFPPGSRRHIELNALGKHIVCELSGCDRDRLTDVDSIHAMMIAAAKAANATVMESAFHRFEPQGVSGTVILAESHLSIHTWPEKGYAAMDFYTCGDHTDPWLACEFAAQTLNARTMLTTEFKRGIESATDVYSHVVVRDHDEKTISA